MLNINVDSSFVTPDIAHVRMCFYCQIDLVDRYVVRKCGGIETQDRSTILAILAWTDSEILQSADERVAAVWMRFYIAISARLTIEDHFLCLPGDGKRRGLDWLRISLEVFRTELEDSVFFKTDGAGIGIAVCFRRVGAIQRVLGPRARFRRAQFYIDLVDVDTSHWRGDAGFRIGLIVDTPGECLPCLFPGTVFRIAKHSVIAIAIDGEFFVVDKRKPIRILRIGRFGPILCIENRYRAIDVIERRDRHIESFCILPTGSVRDDAGRGVPDIHRVGLFFDIRPIAGGIRGAIFERPGSLRIKFEQAGRTEARRVFRRQRVIQRVIDCWRGVHIVMRYKCKRDRFGVHAGLHRQMHRGCHGAGWLRFRVKHPFAIDQK